MTAWIWVAATAAVLGLPGIILSGSRRKPPRPPMPGLNMPPLRPWPEEDDHHE